MAVPLQSDSFEAVFRIGRSANAAAFGKAWDTWRDALANPNSVPTKLQALRCLYRADKPEGLRHLLMR